MVPIEWIIVGGTAMALYHVYTDGKHYKQFMAYKKYWTILGYGLVGLVMYILIKRHPTHAQGMVLHAADVIQYMPIHQKFRRVLSPILNLTGPTYMDTPATKSLPPAEPPSVLAKGGGTRVCKRSVSETKKKYVASLQGWTCGQCRKQLNAWFEVDHKKRLDQGGTNEVSNLVALCRECHGGKTAMENM